MSTQQNRQKRGPGRPRKDEQRVTSRPKRVPVSGQRDILTVEGKNPDFYYRWVKDHSENGHRILRFLRAGYDFVGSDEGLVIGEDFVYKSENIGSVYRVPANDAGEYYYLMKQPIEFYEEDQAAKEDYIRQKEQGLKQPDPSKGQYGEAKITRAQR